MGLSYPNPLGLVSSASKVLGPLYTFILFDLTVTQFLHGKQFWRIGEILGGRPCLLIQGLDQYFSP